jgi:predicted short-subunit dehydrogenase-like oxidoreductase (DUF2520 family)
MKPQNRWTVGIIGVGRAGRALGYALQAAGWEVVSGWSRSMTTAAQASALLNLSILSGWDALPEAVMCADVLLLCVSDDAIHDTASRLAPLLKPDQVLLHTSGSVSSSVLLQAGVKAHCGSFHPLLSLVDPERAAQNLQHAFAGIEGQGLALEVALALGGALGCTVVPIQTDQKAAYHASAVVVSNYFVTLFDAGLQLLEHAGVNRPVARAMLSSLARSTLLNLSKLDPADALTGPVSRGDAATIEAHLAALRSSPTLSPILALYQALLPPTISLAQAAGLPPEAAEALKKISK